MAHRPARLLLALTALATLSAGVSPTFADAPTKGLWIDPTTLASLPTSGPAWTNLLAKANQSCNPPVLSNQDDAANVCVMAKALVFARTGQETYRLRVVDAIWALVNARPYSGRALALGRELGTYPIAADLIDLKTYDPRLDGIFRETLANLLTTRTDEGPANLVECHESRPNNWGTHCGAARAAIAAYLGDNAQLARVAQVFQGWLGNRGAYAGFVYGDSTWQCDGNNPVGINPKGCTKAGHSLDGALPDDQRRSEAGFVWPPPKVNYAWEALQGALVQAVILHRSGYPAFAWSDSAILRAFLWLNNEAQNPAVGDDTWQPYLANYFYGAYGVSFPTSSPARTGKSVGFTDWTHQGTAPLATLSVSPREITFTPGEAATATVEISNASSGPLAWAVTTSDARLRVSPAAGSGATTVTVSLDTAGLTPGRYAGELIVASAGAQGSPTTIAVSITIDGPPPVSPFVGGRRGTTPPIGKARPK